MGYGFNGNGWGWVLALVSAALYLVVSVMRGLEAQRRNPDLEGYLDRIQAEREARPAEAMLADEIRRLRKVRS